MIEPTTRDGMPSMAARIEASLDIAYAPLFPENGVEVSMAAALSWARNHRLQVIGDDTEDLAQINDLRAGLRQPPFMIVETTRRAR